ncbi:MAG: DUF2993 domain-containing protein [Rhizonema sp. PD37]|nr:DUF2993 domain-containing protein [Rhizonema sp. PD37]
MPEKNSETRGSYKSRIVTNILTKALKLWLKTQVSQISQLEIEIGASDRQLLSGCIPRVSIFATHPVYKGLHITQVQLVAENIHINIGSVLKGQALQLLEIIPVVGELILHEEDLNASLSSELLSTALNDLLVQLLPEHSPKSKSMNWENIHLDCGQATISATTVEGNPKTINIFLGLKLLGASVLQLAPVLIKSNLVALLEDNDGQCVDLGSDVDIQELTLSLSKLVCRGRINVNP